MKQKLGVIAILIVVALMAAACGGREGTVQGTVTEALDAAKPLDDPSNVGPGVRAEVVAYYLKEQENSRPTVYVKGLIAHKQMTADDGTYSFTLERGDYVIEVWYKGIEVDTRQIAVKGGGTTVVDWNVAPRP